MPSTQPREIVIVGGGLIGVSTAYYLSKNSNLHSESKITLVEQDNVGAGNSGYASGLLERTEDELSQEGFDLHYKLSKDYKGDLKWGYKSIDLYKTTSHSSSSSSSSLSSSIITFPFLPSTSLIRTKTETAICQPFDLTRHLCGLFLTYPGASIVIAKATSCIFEDEVEVENNEKEEKGISDMILNHTPCIEKITQFFNGTDKEDNKNDNDNEKEENEKINNNEKIRKRKIKGINVKQIINGVEEIIHLKANTLILSPGNDLINLSKNLFGEEISLNLKIKKKEWESIILKPKEKLNPLVIKFDENKQNLEMIFRDDGKVIISRPFQENSLNSYIESISSKFNSSNGTLILSKTNWSISFLSDNFPLFGKFGEELDIDGIWYGIGGNTVQCPAIGSRLASEVLSE
ncbi:uncharacterized protein I206_107279 [Kwoniella pini CBS 10737]|uniref:FAD dependent oxidoreductase domain-containing protein n=1 Tax=Kwoniella pini CBS 10737 TaxID=1296096 RepID=A0A1B9HYN5_9TREE|nr:uncharacterized protein I206_05176 [Kwoniella pini CBS 10737]OCF48399.1 hypothetical protein I206_05176 [Kwoniella pini CBS 10737]